MPCSCQEYLAHYGVKGQKWGVRNYQYADGGYTPAGAQRYWGGTGQGRTGSGLRPGTKRGPVSSGPPSYARSGPVSSGPSRRPGVKSSNASSQGARRSKQLTPEQQAARRAKTKKVIAVGATVAVAAALGYAAYKGSTNLRDQKRADVYKNFNTDWRNVNTLNSKYWDSADRRKYNEISTQRAKDVANSITRREAVASKIAEKTGVKINIPQSRKSAMAERVSANRYANAIRDFENRGAMNKKISDARKDLRRVQESARRSEALRSNIQERRYGEHLNSQWDNMIEQRRNAVNNLLEQRKKSLRIA